MKSHQSSLENLIRQSLHEEAEQIQIPSSDIMWNKILNKRNRNLRYKSLRKQIATAAIIIILLGVSAYLFKPSPVIALNSKIFKMMVDILGFQGEPADVNISMSSKSTPPPGSPPPPPDWPLATSEKVVTFAEAEVEACFSFKKPTYITKGLEFDIVTILGEFNVNQYYKSEKNRLVISQRYTPEQFASSSFFANAQVKKVKINGVDGSFVKQHNPYTGSDSIFILWFDDNIEFRVDTDLNEKEALKIVRSIK